MILKSLFCNPAMAKLSLGYQEISLRSQIKALNMHSLSCHETRALLFCNFRLYLNSWLNKN